MIHLTTLCSSKDSTPLAPKTLLLPASPPTRHSFNHLQLYLLLCMGPKGSVIFILLLHLLLCSVGNIPAHPFSLMHHQFTNWHISMDIPPLPKTQLFRNQTLLLSCFFGLNQPRSIWINTTYILKHFREVQSISISPQTEPYVNIVKRLWTPKHHTNLSLLDIPF